MNDKELLKLAAKAAGLVKDDSPYNGGGFGNDGFSITGSMILDWHEGLEWNPLEDDGDALRLAVKLGMQVDICDVEEMTYIMGRSLCDEEHGNDPYAATRRAIVRAAAEIGKQLREKK